MSASSVPIEWVKIISDMEIIRKFKTELSDIGFEWVKDEFIYPDGKKMYSLKYPELPSFNHGICVCEKSSMVISKHQDWEIHSVQLTFNDYIHFLRVKVRSHLNEMLQRLDRETYIPKGVEDYMDKSATVSILKTKKQNKL